MNDRPEPPWVREDDDLDGSGVDEGDLDGVRLPRIQGGTRARPQHLILTLLGDYWFDRGEHLPSAALVDLVEEFEVSAASARTALSRLGRRGLMASSKAGRRTYYGLAEHTKMVMRATRGRILSFGLPAGEAWDGSWLMVTFSVPHDQRDMGHILRRRLRWLGFAPLYGGVWVSARPVADEVRALFVDVAIEQAAVFRAEELFSTAGVGTAHHPLAAWDLPGLREVYEQFVERFSGVHDRMVAGTIGAAEALVERTAVMDTWRHFPSIDPELPLEVLPADWPRDRARAIFAEVYDGLGPLAEARFTQILGRYEAGLGELVSRYTTTSVLGSRA